MILLSPTYRSICRECNKVVYTDADESSVPFVVLSNQQTMHAECYDIWQERLKAKAEAGKKAVAR